MSGVDTAQLDLMFTELRLPTFKAAWTQLAQRADTEGWPAARLLGALAEQEIADRARRRFERHLAEAKLPPGKTLANFDFNVVPMVSKAHVNALVAGDGWLDQGANLILVGPPGAGEKSLGGSDRPGAHRKRLPRPVCAHHRSGAENSRSRAANWCSRPPSANCTSTTCSSSTTSPTCVRIRPETSVLFELISSRYENRSLLVTANQPFGDWGSIFPEQAMTLAAIDRLVHRATIFELNVESYRRRTAVETKRSRGRIASRATPANTKVKLPGGASPKNKQVQENNP